MSAYNTIKLSYRAHELSKTSDITIQFKYGEVWQHEYKIGDQLIWGDNEIGSPLDRIVIVEGVLEDDGSNQDIPELFEIQIVDGIIKSVTPSSGKYNFNTTDNDFIVLE